MVYFIVIAVLAGCVPSAEHVRAKRLFYTIRRVNDSVFSREAEWSKLMAYAVSTGNYADLRPARIAMENTLDSGFDRISKLPDGGGSETFHQAELALLRLQKEIIREHMMQFEKLHYNTPMTTVSESVAQLKAIAAREKILTDKLEEARDSFAEENALKFAE